MFRPAAAYLTPCVRDNWYARSQSLATASSWSSRGLEPLASRSASAADLNTSTAEPSSVTKCPSLTGKIQVIE